MKVTFKLIIYLDKVVRTTLLICLFLAAVLEFLHHIKKHIKNYFFIYLLGIVAALSCQTLVKPHKQKYSVNFGFV